MYYFSGEEEWQRRPESSIIQFREAKRKGTKRQYANGEEGMGFLGLMEQKDTNNNKYVEGGVTHTTTTNKTVQKPLQLFLHTSELNASPE